MSIRIHKAARRITAADIYAEYTNGCDAASTVSGDINGGYEFSTKILQGGCGNPDSGFMILFADAQTGPYNRIACEYISTGFAACWTCHQKGYGAAIGTTGPSEMSQTNANNIYTYSAADGDRAYGGVPKPSPFQVPSTIIEKWNACDNGDTNMHRYNDQKSWYVIGRRIEDGTSNGGRCGVWFGRSCTSTNQMIGVRNIYVWQE